MDLQDMLRSWTSGDFWIPCAGGKSWAFDAIFWTRIDRRFFGVEGNERIASIQNILELLTQEKIN